CPMRVTTTLCDMIHSPSSSPNESSISLSVYTLSVFFFLIKLGPPSSTLFPYTTLFRSYASPWARPVRKRTGAVSPAARATERRRSEEHTSELQSLTNLVCRLLLEKKNIRDIYESVSEKSLAILSV